jgi:hypothetical protein
MASFAERDGSSHIEAQLVIERDVDCVGHVELDERVSVGGRAHHLLGGEIAGGADPILDDELLSEPFGQPLAIGAWQDRRRRRAQSRRQNAPAALDKLALLPSARLPATRQCPRPDARICGGKDS